MRAANGTSERKPLFFYDLGSPYAYLAAERIDALLSLDAECVPILAGRSQLEVRLRPRREGDRSWPRVVSACRDLVEERQRGEAEEADLLGLFFAFPVI